MKAVILVGVSGSGKSTYAQKLVGNGYVQIERDRIREEILSRTILNMSTQNLWAHWRFNKTNEKEVNERVNGDIETFANMKTDIVISDTNLSRSKRMGLKSKLESLGYEVTIEVIGKDLNLDVLWKRNTFRKNVLTHNIVAEQYNKFRKEFPKYQLKDTTGKPKAVIFDVDGTLAIMGDRGPFEWDRVGIDGYNDILFHTLVKLYEEGYKIIVLSGRDSVCREHTHNWIDGWLTSFRRNYVEYDLFMRKEGDMRKDNIVKAELFMEHLDGNYQIEAVFDDRPIMVREWQEFGFRVYACGNPYLEF